MNFTTIGHPDFIPMRRDPSEKTDDMIEIGTGIPKKISFAFK